MKWAGARPKQEKRSGENDTRSKPHGATTRSRGRNVSRRALTSHALRSFYGARRDVWFPLSFRVSKEQLGMATQNTPKGAPTSNGYSHDAGVSRLLRDGSTTRAVWFEAIATEWQAIVDEDSDPGFFSLPMK